ncbi:MAG: GFA family protein [Alphaproteobacteria bacterium]|nr:GFA family protein [Alphaproteobacteria bacterium]
MNSGQKERLNGSCHCGKVVFAVPADTDFSQGRRCDCSLCRRRWAVMASVPKDELNVISGEDNLGCYTWNTGTARHYFCKTCGIYTHHLRRSDPNEYGINITCFDHVDMKAYDGAVINDGVNHPSDQK